MSRLNAGLDILQMIIDLEQQVEEFKQLQRVGSDVVRTEKLSTAAQWDFDETVNAGDATQNFTIRFTPSNPVAGKPPAAFSVVYHELITGDYPYLEYVSLRPDIRRKKVTDPLNQEWDISATARGGFGTPVRFRAKFYVLTTGKGTVTVV